MGSGRQSSPRTVVPTAGGGVQWRYCAAVLTVVNGVAWALLASGNAGALEVSLAGRSPVAITADRVSVSGLSIAPGPATGGKTDAALLELFKNFHAEQVCLASPVRIPLAGDFMVQINMESLTASDFAIEASGLSASRLSMSKTGLEADVNDADPMRPFQLKAGTFRASQVTIKPRSFTAATLSARGFRASVIRDMHGCASGEHS